MIINVGNSGRRALFAALWLGLMSGSEVALAELPPDAGPDVQVTDAARDQFQVGVALLQDPDGARYEEAYRAFKKAYADSPSWKILGNLGLCALKLERFDDGIEALSRYLKHGGDQLPEHEREQVARDLKVMRATGAKIVLTVTGEGSMTLRDTRHRAVGGPINNSYDVGQDGRLELTVASGKHTLTVRSGERSAQRELTLESGETTEIELSLDEAAPTPAPAKQQQNQGQSQFQSSGPTDAADSSSGSGLRTAGFVVAGVGVAGLIGAGVTAGLGFGLKGKVKKNCPENTCVFSNEQEEQDYNDDLSSLKTYGTLTTAFAIGGGVLAAAGVTMIIVGGGGKKESVALQLTPSLGPAFSGFMAQGAF